ARKTRRGPRVAASCASATADDACESATVSAPRSSADRASSSRPSPSNCASSQPALASSLSTSAQPLQPAAARAATISAAGVRVALSRSTGASSCVARHGCPLSTSACAAESGPLVAIACASARSELSLTSPAASACLERPHAANDSNAATRLVAASVSMRVGRDRTRRRISLVRYTNRTAAERRRSGLTARPIGRLGRGRFVHQPVLEPLAQATQPVDEQPGLAGARQVVVRARIAHEFGRHVLLLERLEPELRVADRRAEVLFALHEQRRRLHVLHVTDRRQRVVHDLVVPWMAEELVLREPLRVGRTVPVGPFADHAIGLGGL